MIICTDDLDKVQASLIFEFGRPGRSAIVLLQLYNQDKRATGLQACQAACPFIRTSLEYVQGVQTNFLLTEHRYKTLE